jgi:hypothetical protein
MSGTANAATSPNGRDVPAVQLQTALADPSFAGIFVLDPTVNDPDWGMQVRAFVHLRSLPLVQRTKLPSATDQ